MQDPSEDPVNTPDTDASMTENASEAVTDSEVTENDGGSQEEDEDDSEGEDVEVEAFEKLVPIPSPNRSGQRVVKYLSSVVDSRRWVLRVYPKGRTDTPTKFVAFLSVDGHEGFAQGWYRKAKMSLEIVHPTDPDGNLKPEEEDAVVTFNAEGVNQGYALTEWKDLEDSPFVKDGQLTLRVWVKVLREKGCSKDYSGGWGHNSHAATGQVGLKNQGATCYMNSLLQALFNTDALRRAVYQMPTEADEPTKSIPLALQRLFYRLQFGNHAVGTKELTASFGWKGAEAFVQHDVQELNRVLCDKLEEKMKGTVVEGTIEKLFRGQYQNYIECINVEWKSKRKEAFYDVSLVVKGCATLEDSLAKFVESEVLDGDNQYKTDEHGKQDVRKGIYFGELPPVLFLQLKRFDFDMRTLRNYKVNDKHVFGETLDMLPYIDPDVRAEKGEAAMAAQCGYQLHGVLVHAGQSGGGHYYAYFRPTPKKRWFKYNDSRVTRATSEEAIEGNYGGSVTMTSRWTGTAYQRERSANAYMLVYIRTAEVNTILKPVGKEEIPRHLIQRFEEEEAERLRKRKEKQEAHLYTRIKLITDEDMKTHTEVDLWNWKRVPEGREFRVAKQSTVLDFKQQCHELFPEVQPERMRFWSFTKRMNKTVRPSKYINAAYEAQPVVKSMKPKAVELKLLMEVSPRTEAPFFDDLDSKTQAQIFFKFYDPAKQTLELVLRKQVNRDQAFGEFAAELKAEKGLDPDTPITFFEEIKFKPPRIDHIPDTSTLAQAEIGNGDIVCFQVAPEALEASTLRASAQGVAEGGKLKLPTAKDYYEWLASRYSVTFKRLADYTKDPGIRLDLLKTNTWDEVAQALTAALPEDQRPDDPDKLRFTQHSNISYRPAWNGPLVKREGSTLNDMIKSTSVYRTDTADIIYYEVLPFTMEEMRNKVQVDVVFWNAKGQQTWQDRLTVDKDSTVGQLRALIATKAPLEGPVPDFVDKDEQEEEQEEDKEEEEEDKKQEQQEEVEEEDKKPEEEEEEKPEPKEPAANAAAAAAAAANSTGQVYLFQSFGNKVWSKPADDEAITRYAKTNSHTKLVAQEIQPEELELDYSAGDVLLNCTHVEFEHYPRPFGKPFLLGVAKGTTLGQVKQIIQKRLQVPGKEWSKYQLVGVTYSNKHDLGEDDEDITAKRWTGSHAMSYLGMIHANKHRGAAAYGGYRRREQALVIHDVDDGKDKKKTTEKTTEDAK